MTQKHLQTISFFLILSMLLIALVGCKGSGDEKTTDDNSSTTTDNAEAGNLYDSNGFLKDDLPESFENSPEEVSVFYWSDAENKEYKIDSLSGSDIVSNSLYKRNLTVADRMGVEINFVGCKGDYNACGTFNTTLLSTVSAGEQYDIVSAYSMTMAVCARDGMLANMKNSQYVNLEKPWWPEGLVETCNIGDAVYFCTGDASINSLYMMYCCYFNKQLLTDFHSDIDLYEVVKNGEWTYEKMLTLINGVYIDEGASGRNAAEDTFGMIGCTLYSNSMIEAFGFDEIVNRDGLLTISDEWDGSRVDDVISDLNDMFDSEYAVSGTTADVRDGFNTGRSLFAVLYADQAAKRFSKNQDLSYGVVPLPKLDTSQNEYITPVANPASFYGICNSSLDVTFAGAFLECWASEGYRQVSPSLFEKSFKLKYSADNDNALMYDYIRNGMKFNTARLFALASNGDIATFTLDPVLDEAKVSWMTYTEAKKTAMTLAIRELNSFFENLQ